MSRIGEVGDKRPGVLNDMQQLIVHVSGKQKIECNWFRLDGARRIRHLEKANRSKS